MNKTYLFGILPALIGAVIFILWYVTNVEYFILAGMLFLYIGGASVVVGIISSFIQLIKYKNFKTFSIGLGLNLSNIPLAFILASSAISIITAYTVKFENSGSSIVKELHLTGPNINIQINSLEVGRKAKSILHFK